MFFYLLLALREEELVFGSMIMRLYYRALLCNHPYRMNYRLTNFWNDINPLEFMTKMISNFNGRFLSNGKDLKLYERLYQDETYRSASILSDESPCPEGGALFGLKGYPDFYISRNNRWGIVLLRNGNRLHDHSNRNNDYGTDATERINFSYNQILVVDFYEEDPETAMRLDEHYYRVIFDKDFKTAKLISGASEILVNLS